MSIWIDRDLPGMDVLWLDMFGVVKSFPKRMATPRDGRDAGPVLFSGGEKMAVQFVSCCHSWVHLAMRSAVGCISCSSAMSMRFRIRVWKMKSRLASLRPFTLRDAIFRGPILEV